ncbi:hypothetical protein HID58_009862 [Brassica napus]|uniref:ABC transporter domain-containing protein n=1 Tax=Brassica napus TaxID=3708 RepID=A0ABQ8DTP6_BRANA|nr:hypothetical protein HID58_009862 [Brassica napus]
MLGRDEDLVRTKSRRGSLGSSSYRSLRGASRSFRDVLILPAEDNVCGRSERREEDDVELKWAALERLPTYDRLRKGMLPQQTSVNGKAGLEEVDLTKLAPKEKKHLMEIILKFVEEDNEKFLRRLRERTDRVGIEVPKIEVRYENISVQGDVRSASRALPTLFNVTLNTLESILGMFHLLPSKKSKIQILKNISGIVKPSRMTLLLGPPSSGKTTFLQALAGKLDDTLQMSGRITYCGHEFSEFVPQKTCAYISQHDLHFGEMTILGLDICADIPVGDEMRRGVSGGQMKRLTTGEMLVGPATALFMDEISTGLDSSTTFQICKFMRQLVHISDVTMIISLLQPAPETFELFDDIILLSEGHIVYQGPRDKVLEFFEYMGFQCPERKGVADFLQEVTSKKDQEQYWNRREQPYSYVSESDFSSAFNSFHTGQQLASDMRVPYEKAKTHPAALVTQKYGISNRDLFKACFDREWLLMKRNSFVYVFKTVQITIMSLIAMTVYLRTEMHVGTVADGQKFYGALFFSLINVLFNGMVELGFTVMRLPVFYKQRDFLFYPPWAFALPAWLLKIPLSLIESGIWIAFTYYTIGFAPAASRFFRQLLAYFCVNQMALSLFRFLGAVGRTEVISNSVGTFTMLIIFTLGGFIIAKDDIPPWMTWAYYISPMMYGQTAIVMNEFLDDRWGAPNNDTRINAKTVGEVLLKSRGFVTEPYWFWICIVALLGFSLLFNLFYIIALMYLNPLGDSKATVVEEDKDKQKGTEDNVPRFLILLRICAGSLVELSSRSSNGPKRGMVLPFQPLSLAFNSVNYYVDMPAEMKAQGVEGDRLQLLRDVGGAFRPGILTALVGVSGAGKTTLMDVLAGRKTGGNVEGSISISGYPKNQSTFARVSGYCEQNDIHSPHVTVYESLIYSAWLRLSVDIDAKTREMFVEEVMELVELKPLRNSIVGLPGVDGLSTEQRKRLTIAVELVANPSIIFMDEPTSGLDARAAAIVMRTVRNTVDTGRTVVCTIHQPSIDIFESFDELLLMKRGGQVIYAGSLGHQSQKLIEYFEAVEGVPKIKDGYNPATWMLDVTTPSMESQMSLDFAQIFTNSSLYGRNQELIKELSTPPPGSNDLYFPTKYSQPFWTQTKACLWKQYWSNWRFPQYNSIRFLMTIAFGLLFGLIFWQTGTKIEKEQDLNNFFGAMYAAVLFLGATNAAAVQPVIAIERTVFYREKAAGMYSAIPYAISKVAVEIMYNTIQTGVYTLILYSMIGYDWTVTKFLWFYYYMLTSFIYFTLYGMMLMALTPNPQIAGICMSFFVVLWNLFSGFLIPRPQIPIWWRWYYWATPVAWTLYGIITSQVGDKDSIVQITGVGDMSLKTLLKNGFGFEHDFLPVVAAVHIAWILLFAFVFAYGIKFLNFQRR